MSRKSGSRSRFDRGDPAVDFAQRFIGVSNTSAEVTPTWSNRGLPLEVVNALRLAPPGRFWSSVHDNARLKAIKDVLSMVEAPESEETIASRRLLLAFCHNRFEPDNRRLIETLGWKTDGFVPAPEEGARAGEPELAAIDELWRPRASEAELAALYTALERALAAEERERALAAELALADARAEWEAVSASFEWRVARGLRHATSRLRRRPPADDPSIAISRRLTQAANRVEGAMPSANGAQPPAVNSARAAATRARTPSPPGDCEASSL